MSSDLDFAVLFMSACSREFLTSRFLSSHARLIDSPFPESLAGHALDCVAVSLIASLTGEWQRGPVCVSDSELRYRATPVVASLCTHQK